MPQTIVFREFNSAIHKSGDFHSPNWPYKYPQDVRYFYIFQGAKNQQVHIKFKHFNIEGLSNKCKKDFVDVYTDMREFPRHYANLTNTFLFHQVMLGRYCGHNLEYIPNSLVSRHNILVLDLFTDTNTQYSYNQDDHMGKLGFQGNFSFQNNDMLTNYLANHSKYPCFYSINFNQSVSSNGFVYSPNYPSISNFPLDCMYEFRTNQLNYRVEIIFLNIQLYELRDSCPVEYVDIIDGDPMNPDSPYILHKFCGFKSLFRIISTSNRLFLRFTVFAGRNFLKEPHNMNKYKSSLQTVGFKLQYRFRDDLVDGSFENRIPGTECDMAFKSDYRKTGTISSPKFSPNVRRKPVRSIICNYFFFGEHNSQKMEIILLNFTYIRLPSSRLSYSGSNCTMNFISIYSTRFKVENLITRQRRVIKNTKPLKVLCSSHSFSTVQYKAPSPVTIIQLKVTNDVNLNKEIGFMLDYQFIKDYGISGQSVEPGKCHYRYKSESNVNNFNINTEGLINSPFYNNFYPNNASCQYDLEANPDEIVRLVFVVFQTSETVSSKLINYHDVHLSCRQDFLSISEMVQSGQRMLINVTERYCGTSLPGLLVSQRNSMGFTLKFYSDSHINGPGFLAKYQFMKKRPLFYDCGTNISLIKQSGIIVSPNYPRRYKADLICEWHLWSINPNDRVILLFTNFQIEGTIKSCSNAVLRIHEGSNVKAHSELCGTDSAIPSYVSMSNFIRIRFLTDTSSVGAKGFRIIWTRVMPLLVNGTCPGYKCFYSGHCIHRNLTCNRQYNCGSYINKTGIVTVDRSDEYEACPVAIDRRYLYSGLAIVAMIIILLFVVIMIYLHKTKDLMKSRQKVLHEKSKTQLNSNNSNILTEPLNITNEYAVAPTSTLPLKSYYSITTPASVQMQCRRPINSTVAFAIPNVLSKHLSLNEIIPFNSPTDQMTQHKFQTSENSCQLHNLQHRPDKTFIDYHDTFVQNCLPTPNTNQHQHQQYHDDQSITNTIDQLDSLSEQGYLTREKMQKISMV